MYLDLMVMGLTEELAEINKLIVVELDYWTTWEVLTKYNRSKEDSGLILCPDLIMLGIVKSVQQNQTSELVSCPQVSLSKQYTGHNLLFSLIRSQKGVWGGWKLHESPPSTLPQTLCEILGKQQGLNTLMIAHVWRDLSWRQKIINLDTFSFSFYSNVYIHPKTDKPNILFFSLILEMPEIWKRVSKGIWNFCLGFIKSSRIRL